MRAARPGVQSTDQGVLELPSIAFEGERSLEDLLPILNFERICSNKVQLSVASMTGCSLLYILSKVKRSGVKRNL
jgi:hypothetical protein